MKCNCGNQMEEHTITKAGVIVSHYQMCDACERVYIRTSSDYLITARAIAHNLALRETHWFGVERELN